MESKNMVNEDQFILNIKVVRGVRGLTAEALSLQAFLPKKRVADIETGRHAVSVRDACAICNVLNVGLDKMATQKAVASISFENIK